MRATADHYQDNGIWAVDPSRPNDPDREIQLTDSGRLILWNGPAMAPSCWSAPWARTVSSVLHADGTKTLIANGGYFDGSFSPDGSQVIYTP